MRAVGELHAVIHPDLPRFHNSGYVVTCGESKLFHPGDALTPPGEPVDLLCVVVSAPWMKAADAVDFARLVGAPRNLAIHDRIYSEAGLGIVDGHLSRLLPETSPTSAWPTAPTSTARRSRCAGAARACEITVATAEGWFEARSRT